MGMKSKFSGTVFQKRYICEANEPFRVIAAALLSVEKLTALLLQHFIFFCQKSNVEYSM